MTTGTALPDSPEALEELLRDTARMGAIDAEGGMPKFLEAYLGSWRAKHAEMIRAFGEQSQLDLQKFMQDQREQNGAVPADRARLAARTPPKGMTARRARSLAMSRLPKADLEADRQRLFALAAAGSPAEIDESPYASNLKRFLFAVVKGEVVARMRGNGEEAARLQAFKGQLADIWDAMGERVPSEGGFLVPETLRSEVLMVALEDEVMAPRATIIPMDSLWASLPSIDDTSHATNVFGGVQGFWTEEGASLSPSQPSFARVRLQARKLTAYTAIPNELLQDSITPMDTWFDVFFPQALAFFHDVAFISGTGVGEPEGLTAAPGAVRVPCATLNKIQYADVVKVLARMWPASLKRAIWLAAPDTIPELAQMAVSADGGGTTVAPPVFLPDFSAENSPGGYDGRTFRLFNRPGFVSEKVPALANSTSTPGALMLVDPSYYLIGDRQAMQIASSTEYLFAQDEVAYRVTERKDGRFWLRSAITPNNGSSSTLSPLVKLDTTATS